VHSQLRLSLTDALPSDPPKEFRIFRSGVNKTHKGDVIFDEIAAQNVMNNAAIWGVRLMIDLEHESLEEGPGIRPDSKDARGWYSLEIRNGDLWASDAEWTPDGARRLSEKTQRYISPAIITDEDGRLSEIVNAALVAMPATFKPQDLLAAKRLRLLEDGERREIKELILSQVAEALGTARFAKGFNRMNPDDVKAALEAVKTDDKDAAIALLENLLVAAASGEEASAEPAADDAGEMALEQDPEEPPTEDEVAMSRAVLTALGRDSIDGAAAEAKRLIALGLKYEQERGQTEAARRRELTARLVKLGKETPATAWEGDPDARNPAQHIRAMSLDALEKRVKAFEAVHKPGPRAPAKEDLSAPTEREQALIKKYKMNPEQARAFIEKNRATGSTPGEAE
jgi:phage I-like protein